MRLFLGFFLFALGPLPRPASAMRMCKPEILRSFGLSSLMEPNSHNPLCPSIDFNCCSRHDILAIHKMHNTLYDDRARTYYRTAFEDFKYTAIIFKMKDTFRFKMYIQYLEEKFKVPKRMVDHLLELNANLSKYDYKYYVNVFDQLVEQMLLKKQYEDIYKLRQSFFCGMCSWQNQQYISIESHSLTMKEEFCLFLSSRFVSSIYLKYVELFRVLLTIDELILLMTEKKFLTDKERKEYRRLSLIVERCNNSPRNINECEEFCQEFRLNEYTPLFDGEQNFGKRLFEFYGLYLTKFQSSDASRVDDILKFKSKSWTFRRITTFTRHFSILNKNYSPVLSLSAKKANSFGLMSEPSGKRAFIKKNDITSPIEFDVLDNETDPSILYQLADQPLDLNNFQMRFVKSQGIDLTTDMQSMYLDMDLSNLLSLLYSNRKSIDEVDESLDPIVESYLKAINIKDLNDFALDHHMDFSSDEDLLSKSGSRNLNGIGMLFVSYFFAFILIF